MESASIELEPSLDLSVLEALRNEPNGSDDLLTELSEIFLRDVPARLAALRTAALAGNTAGTLSTAHALKGTCATFGARRMATLAEQAERNAALHQRPISMEEIRTLEQEFETVSKLVREYLQTVSNSRRASNGQ